MMSAWALARLSARPRSTRATSARHLPTFVLLMARLAPGEAAGRQQSVAPVEPPVHRDGDEGEAQRQPDPHPAPDETERKREDQRGDEADRPVAGQRQPRSEEHTSELQSLMRTPYAVFC